MLHRKTPEQLEEWLDSLETQLLLSNNSNSNNNNNNNKNKENNNNTLMWYNAVDQLFSLNNGRDGGKESQRQQMVMERLCVRIVENIRSDVQECYVRWMEIQKKWSGVEEKEKEKEKEKEENKNNNKNGNAQDNKGKRDTTVKKKTKDIKDDMLIRQYSDALISLDLVDMVLDVFTKMPSANTTASLLIDFIQEYYNLYDWASQHIVPLIMNNNTNNNNNNVVLAKNRLQYYHNCSLLHLIALCRYCCYIMAEIKNFEEALVATKYYQYLSYHYLFHPHHHTVSRQTKKYKELCNLLVKSINYDYPLPPRKSPSPSSFSSNSKLSLIFSHLPSIQQQHDSILTFLKIYKKNNETASNKQGTPQEGQDVDFEMPTLNGYIQGYSMECRLCGRLCLFEQALIAIQNSIHLAENEILSQLKWAKEKNTLMTTNEKEEYQMYQKEYIELYTLRGNTYSNLDAFELGFQDSDLCLTLSPKSDSYVNRAFAYYQLKKYPECIQDCDIGLEKWESEQATQIGDDFDNRQLIKGLLLGNRGIAEKRSNLYEKAILDLNRCIKKVPQSRIARQMLKEIWDEVVNVLYNHCKDVNQLILPKDICCIIAFHAVGIDFELNEDCHPSTMVFGQ